MIRKRERERERDRERERGRERERERETKGAKETTHRVGNKPDSAHQLLELVNAR